MRPPTFPILISAVLAAAAASAVTACGPTDREPAPQPGAPAPQPDAPATIPVSVHFTRNERPVPVPRDVPAHAPLRGALEQLLQGPTRAERQAGLTSFFSPATAGMLRSVDLDARGRATIDFADLRPVIPNASTSAGSAALLGELNATVFQFPTVHEAEYRINESCAAFWNFLQRDCTIVRRPGH